MKIGDIHFTGNEESGGCWFCGGELPKRRRRWCCDEHMNAYWDNYNWTAASRHCSREAKNICTNCHQSHAELSDEIRKQRDKEGYYLISFVDAQIEVHHIIPMKGEDRQWHTLNRQDNLIALCHQCHLQAHAAMREPKLPKSVRDKQGLIEGMKKAGQLELL